MTALRFSTLSEDKNNILPCTSSLCCVMLVFSFGCILDCVCASLQPVRSHQSSLQLVEARLGRGGVTKLGSEPPGVFAQRSSR